MGIFDLFKKKATLQSDKDASPFESLLMNGPTFFEGYTVPIDQGIKQIPFEWKRKLQSLSGGSRFHIKYYGELHKKYPGLLIRTDFAPLLVVAIDIQTGNEILLFDGCRHGYNAMFCDNYNENQRANRIADNYYLGKNGENVFEILISAIYQPNEDELAEMMDINGNFELLDGTIVSKEVAYRNSFDTFRIWVINEKGEKNEIVSEELS